MYKRYDAIDVERGIGAILVILGHAGIIGLSKTVLYSFHMPLFFFLSGIFLKYDSKHRTEFILKRVYNILVPYFLFYMLLFAKECILVLIGHGSWKNMVKLLIGMVLQMRTTEYGGKFWFLPVLFGGTLICAITEEFVCKLQKKSIRLICAGISFLGGCASIILLKKPLLWNLDAAMIAASFMIIGMTAKEKFLELFTLEKKKCVFLFCVTAIGNISFALWNFWITGRNSDLYWMVIGNPIIYTLASYAGILAITMLAACYQPKMIAFIGRNSLLYYCLHHEFVFPVLKIVVAFLPWQRLAPYYMTVFACILIAPLCVLIKRYAPLFAGIKTYKG